jgi:hypothetical protein
MSRGKLSPQKAVSRTPGLAVEIRCFVRHNEVCVEFLSASEPGGGLLLNIAFAM